MEKYATTLTAEGKIDAAIEGQARGLRSEALLRRGRQAQCRNFVCAAVMPLILSITIYTRNYMPQSQMILS